LANHPSFSDSYIVNRSYVSIPGGRRQPLPDPDGSGREAATAAIFWLKVRAGWREPLGVRQYPMGKKEPQQLAARTPAVGTKWEGPDQLTFRVLVYRRGARAKPGKVYIDELD
jgi:hypothetical protein